MRGIFASRYLWTAANASRGPPITITRAWGLVRAAEDAPGPAARQVAGGHFGDDRGAVLARLLEDVQSPEEVDVRGLAGLDLLGGGDVEITTLRIPGHRLVSGYFLCLLELLLSARAAWVCVIVGREPLPQAPHPG